MMHTARQDRNRPGILKIVGWLVTAVALGLVTILFWSHIGLAIAVLIAAGDHRVCNLQRHSRFQGTSLRVYGW